MSSVIDFIGRPIGTVWNDITPAEITAGVVPVSYQYEPGNLLRDGLVPNSTAARAANTAAFAARFDPTVAGPVGRHWFENTTGSDTYYFDVVPLEIRDGVTLDLNGCTLDFAGSFSAANSGYGFLKLIRNVVIENGAINVNYDGSAGTNNGLIMLIGSRPGHAFGTHTEGIEDEDLSVPQGNITLRNLYLTSNNPEGRYGVLMLGGLRNVVLENIVINGSNALREGIYYEYGFWHWDGSVAANRVSSHASNLTFKNIRVFDLDGSLGQGAGINLVGARSASIDGLHVDTAFSALVIRNGEASFFNEAPGDLVAGRHATIKNVSGLNLSTYGMQLLGSEDASLGYLSASLDEEDMIDLMSFSVDGFDVDQPVQCSSQLVISNGTIKGATDHGLILTDECVQFDVNNVNVLDCSDSGLRASGSPIMPAARRKIGSIRNSYFAGNTGQGIEVENSRHVLIENCRFGHSTAHDGVTEAAQTIAVEGVSEADGIHIKGCQVDAASGTAYILDSASDNGVLEGITGIVTTSGPWAAAPRSGTQTFGDESPTLTVGQTRPTCRFATALTANRTVTLSSSGAYEGVRFRIVREDTAAFTLDVGGLKTIASGVSAWVDVEYGGGVWRLTGYGEF